LYRRIYGELDMFPRFLLFFLSTFAVIRIQFTLPKHGKHIHVTTMYCRSHDFGRDRFGANLDMRLLMCAFETSGILSTACRRLLMRLNVAPAKSQKGVKGVWELRYPVSTWRVEFDIVKWQSVDAHYSLFSIANILNTWAKRINNTARISASKLQNDATDQRCVIKIFIQIVRWGDTTRGDTRGWIGSSRNITFLRGCTMCIYSKGVARSQCATTGL